MQAIITKYLGPTDTRGSRIKATAAAGSITCAYDSAVSSDANHRWAAEQLCKKMGWVSAPTNMYTTLVQGQLPNGDNVFTFLPKEYEHAKQAVFESRFAISKGLNNGNPHCRVWGRKITLLTDTSDGGVWAEEYKAYAKERDL